jgi:uncharacterized OB-fold protein
MSDTTDALATDATHEAWLDALGTDEAFYLRCPDGHGSLPPRRTCLRCGAGSVSEAPLPGVGVVDSFTVTHVAPPRYADDVPYVTAVVDFGDVRLTGVVRGVDADALAIGDRLRAGSGETATRGDRTVVFRPAD